MKLLEQDEYKECSYLKNIANFLYISLDINSLSSLDKYYVIDAYKYINRYSKIRTQLIKQYIIDLKKYIINEYIE